jgi:hypothetical protein
VLAVKSVEINVPLKVFHWREHNIVMYSAAHGLAIVVPRVKCVKQVDHIVVLKRILIEIKRI